MQDTICTDHIEIVTVRTVCTDRNIGSRSVNGLKNASLAGNLWWVLGNHLIKKTWRVPFRTMWFFSRLLFVLSVIGDAFFKVGSLVSVVKRFVHTI